MRFSLVALLSAAVMAGAQDPTSQNRIPVVGVKTGIKSNGERPSRLPIGQLQQSGAQYDIYIQAMAAFMKVDELDPKSYFQIVGVHGLPFVPWNGASQVPGGGGGGYCPHNEILFATWHKPFLALFEQELVAHAIKIAKTYPSNKRAEYVQAAETLRLPYWDWAVTPSLPSAATARTVSITTPKGKQTVTNPLYAYKFQQFPFRYRNFGGQIGAYPETKRCPSSTRSDAQSRHNVVDANLARDASYLRNSVYLTFTRTGTFTIMSSDGQGGYNFESPHNTVHNDIGCGNPTGHMTNLGWSAFEPMFMLHHANVDRLISMWQAAHPGHPMFGGTHSVSYGMYGTPAGTRYGIHTGLKPFYDSKGNLWTSWGTRRNKVFGYTYPEINDWSQSSSQLQQRVTSAVNQLYGSRATNMKKRDVVTVKGKRADKTVNQYMAEIEVERADLELPCTINMYLGDELSGTFTLLGMPKAGKSYGNIPLQEPLDTIGAGIEETAEDKVIKFLKKTLRVEAVTPDGKTRDIMGIPSLKVKLEVSEVQPSANEDEFPKFLETKNVDVVVKELVEGTKNLVDDVADLLGGIKGELKDKLKGALKDGLKGLKDKGLDGVVEGGFTAHIHKEVQGSWKKIDENGKETSGTWGGEANGELEGSGRVSTGGSKA